MASKFNFGKGLHVIGHEYQKTDYGPHWDGVALVKTVLCQKGGTLPLLFSTTEQTCPWIPKSDLWSQKIFRLNAGCSIRSMIQSDPMVKFDSRSWIPLDPSVIFGTGSWISSDPWWNWWQGCARLIFSGWLDSDSWHPGPNLTNMSPRPHVPISALWCPHVPIGCPYGHFRCVGGGPMPVSNSRIRRFRLAHR